jgi:hypothetical protein
MEQALHGTAGVYIAGQCVWLDSQFDTQGSGTSHSQRDRCISCRFAQHGIGVLDGVVDRVLWFVDYGIDIDERDSNQYHWHHLGLCVGDGVWHAGDSAIHQRATSVELSHSMHACVHTDVQPTTHTLYTQAIFILSSNPINNYNVLLYSMQFNLTATLPTQQYQ